MESGARVEKGRVGRTELDAGCEYMKYTRIHVYTYKKKFMTIGLNEIVKRNVFI